MSGEYYRLLWYRAERFLVRALRDYSEGDYDGACFNAEEAIQLAVKAVLYKYFGEVPRIHGSKVLLSRLRNLLMDAGREDVASLVGRFAADNRDILDLLEESYTMARYGSISYGERQAERCIEIAKKAFEVLKDVEGRLG
ncbi:MAG: HEPN domain-containing protein [Candidatus Bathyarchaeia archaeon]|nr:HEPN domain-containing protein [Candidatus Bathyarchaeota archaeon]